MAERARVLHRAQQHLRVGERVVGLRERDAARFGELAHLGQLLAGQALRQRADRIDVGLVEHPRAVLQHFDESGLVERRIGVGRACEARDAAGDRRLHFGFERRLVLESRFAQPRSEIDEARRDDETRRVQRAVGLPVRGRPIDGRDPSVRAVQRAGPVDAVRGIDDAAVADLDVHQLPAMMLITAIRTAMPNVT